MKIEKLTLEQEQALSEWRDRWLTIGRTPGAANMEAVKPIIADFYSRLGYEAPLFVNCQSPLRAQMHINLMHKQLEWQPNQWLGEQLRGELEWRLWLELQLCHFDKQLGTELQRQLGRKLKDELRDLLFRQLCAHLRWQLREELGNHKLKFFDTWLWGSLDYWTAYYLFISTHVSPDIYKSDDLALLEQWAVLAQNCFWWYPFRGICFVCDRPVYRLDSDGRLHSPEAMAMEFEDGYGLYAWHGLAIPKELITEPITLKQIEREGNIEIRRIMMERYGYDRYIQDSDSIRVHEDEYGILWRKDVPGDEPVVMVQVKDPSTSRQYFLRVPPSVTTAHEAVAWTFDLPVSAYRPRSES